MKGVTILLSLQHYIIVPTIFFKKQAKIISAKLMSDFLSIK